MGAALHVYLQAASSLGMQCLIEVHTEAELARVLQLQVGGRQ
jgi:indole-3-glycerol phosphate synthase